MLKHIESQLDTLKDFQKSTLEVVRHHLFDQEKGRYLVADEVGLGKTIVAKGVICEGLRKALRENRKFKVVYICSNQALAGQNLRKLNILRNERFIENTYSRLLFYAYKQDNHSDFQLSSLTPSTSFRFVNGTGWQEERKVIYTILSRLVDFSEEDSDLGLKLLLRGSVQQEVQTWSNNLDEFKRVNDTHIVDDIHLLFQSSLERIHLDEHWSDYFGAELNADRSWSAWDTLLQYSNVLSSDNYRYFRGPYYFISLLRKALTELCIEFLDADLFILDEFQRFKALIDTHKPLEQLSEAAFIAQKVFSVKDAKVLMLSATPFKAYSTRSEEKQSDEDHFEEFKTVLSFLMNGDARMVRYEKARKDLFELLRNPSDLNFESVPEGKLVLEDILRQIIARTERLVVSDDKNVLVLDSHKSETDRLLLKIVPEDIENYISSDKVIKALQDKGIRNVRSIIEFSKSAPYPFSFLDGYQVKRALDNHKSIREIQSSIKTSKKAWLDWNKVHNYKSIEPYPNARFRHLLHHAFKDKLWSLLWIPPSLEYYSAGGAYKDHEFSSKTLVFSSWVMVPRMIAALLSYEAERLTIGDTRLLGDGEGKRVYSQSGNSRRRPYPLLRLRRKSEEMASMTTFTLLYPSVFLTKIFHPRLNLGPEGKDIQGLVQELADRIKSEFDKLQVDVVSEGVRDSKWYWALPVLLDLNANVAVTEQLDFSLATSRVFLRRKDDTTNSQEPAQSANRDHLVELKKFAESPGEFQLGRIPEDLFEVIALQTLASPAVCALRLLQEEFQLDNPFEIFTRALDLATEFQHLFDKPESISAVQLNTFEFFKAELSKAPYWKEVLYYCACGNIQSMMDEFSHMIKGDNDDLDVFSSRFERSINANTVSVNVDTAKSFFQGSSKKMRCHIAVDFGNQNMDKEEGQNRVINMLENFNSPFRPFVLATTSIGQEGLDFHWYCRKIVHWNLPSNPIDFEQREGRINRYKGLVIRQNIAKKFAHLVNAKGQSGLWSRLFEIANREENRGGTKPELVPFWHIEPDNVYIERLLPILPYSKEVTKLKRILDTLTLYRLTLGQPRQEELVDALLENLSEEQIKLVRENFMIDLSPISYK